MFCFLGDWEQAYSRKDKKKKKEDDTPKKSKKSKKSDIINDTKDEKIEIKDKIAKETQNKELKEKNQMEIILEPVNNEIVSEPEVADTKEEIKKVN